MPLFIRADKKKPIRLRTKIFYKHMIFNILLIQTETRNLEPVQQLIISLLIFGFGLLYKSKNFQYL